MRKIEGLKENYEKVCEAYILFFEKKQGVVFDGWVANEVGGVASFISQYFFNFSDIVLDVNTKQKKGLILEWQDDGVQFNFDKKETQYINYNSYTMGLRYTTLQ